MHLANLLLRPGKFNSAVTTIVEAPEQTRLMTAPSHVIRPLVPADAPCPAPIPRRIALLNVKFSPNLGDGLLCECLEKELAHALPGCEVMSVDLAGRQAYPSGHGRGRGMVMALLERCPAVLRRLAAWAILRLLLAIRLHRHFRAGLAGAEIVVLGGGNLFTDADLNFPMKIAGALAQARRSRLPVAVYAIGVSKRWSPHGAKLFIRALRRSRLVWACVRDQGSSDSWRAHFQDHPVRPANIAVDPGVLASLHYPRATRGTGTRIGLCITDPLAVRYHSDGSSGGNLDAWYPEALRSLVQQGFEVALFTNGSPEDREYLYRHFHAWIRYAKGPVALAPSFATPADLAGFVSGCDAIIGHRMHACIAAYSFGVPAVGLRWDVKLDSFFQLSGRTTHMIDPAVEAPTHLGRRTAAAIADRPDPAPLIARARADVATLAAMLRRHAKAVA
ncbi:polysaccharide pyruvyl transferase family protein [Novosphingobium resinovorum]|uniref:polysaccharide pyruvyl transferase family protein n=1 Tax=Novosphingobium resinovorum TaxID=158500 RepID=UPI002ED3FBB1|nr:polysaccharide pyruvyl transferase family protein [Novosphingobium resinovorum]